MPSLRLPCETASAITWQEHIFAPILFTFFECTGHQYGGHDIFNEALATRLCYMYIHVSHVYLQF